MSPTVDYMCHSHISIYFCVPIFHSVDTGIKQIGFHCFQCLFFLPCVCHCSGPHFRLFLTHVKPIGRKNQKKTGSGAKYSD